MIKVIKEAPAELAQTAALLIKKAIADVLRNRTHVVLAIAGGKSVVPIFKLLKSTEGIPWSKVHIFMVDERVVPLDHPDSNFRLARENFIEDLVNNGSLPQENVHPFKLSDGVDQYSAELKTLGGHLDISLISVGEDGHIASLFPDHSGLRNRSESYIEVTGSPKPPEFRISASHRLLMRCKIAVILFIGRSKKQALKTFVSPGFHFRKFPAKLIRSVPESYLLTDIK
jgi:6-phosphogluconolactonase